MAVITCHWYMQALLEVVAVQDDRFDSRVVSVADSEHQWLDSADANSSLFEPRNMSAIGDVACAAIDDSAGALHALSDDIWEHPELNYEERYAHDALTNFLELHGFVVDRHYKLKTAFRAVYGDDNSGPTIAVVCEYDALPSLGHACGHNLIAETGVAAGLGVKAALLNKGKSFGQIVVIGTPAEEGGGGKIKMMALGAFDGLDAVLMAHPGPFTLSKPIYNGAERFLIRYRGHAAHAAAHPWAGVNALDAAVLFYQSVSVLRQQFKQLWRVHVIFKETGESTSIIPSVSSVLTAVRAPNAPELKRLKTKVLKCAEAAADATGCTIEIEGDNVSYLPVVQNNTLCRLFHDHGTSVGMKFNTDQEILNTPGGSTDMGNVSRLVPGMHPKYNIGSSAVNHTPEFTVASGATVAQPYAIQVGKALALTALDLFTKPELLAQAKEDFKNDMAKELKTSE